MHVNFDDQVRSRWIARVAMAGGLLGLAAGAVLFISLHSRAGAEPPARATDNPLRTATIGQPAPQPVAPSKSAEIVASGAPSSVGSSDKAAMSVAPAAGEMPAGQSPLDPALDLAHKVLDNIQKNVKDYTAVIVKQERINGTLLEPEYMNAKVRQKPFSVYLKFLKPDSMKGREVIYVAGANNGKLVAREGSGLKRALGAVWLDPTSALAMIDNRYPITNLGLEFLTKRLVEIAEQDRKYGEVEVHFYKNAKVNNRVCTMIEVIHPTPRRNFMFYKAQVFVDDELQVPIRYQAYLWPKKPGDEPPLDESYTYLNLKLNAGLTDADFDYKSPNYGFVDK
jgi:hypothetical protein